MRTMLIMVLMAFAGSVWAGTTLYRWVDDQGRLHYSDQPQPEAEEIQVGEPSTFKSREANRGREPATRSSLTRPGEEQTASSAFAGYDSVVITAPAPDQVLWNIGGILTVNVRLQPRLQPDHRIKVSYDGEEVRDWPATATSHQIRDVYRGTHIVAVSIIDASGNPVATGEAVTFYVKQTSVLNRP